MSVSVPGLFDFLRRELLDLLPWRQRLPVDPAGFSNDSTECAEHDQRAEHVQHLFRLSGDELRRLSNETVIAKLFL